MRNKQRLRAVYNFLKKNKKRFDYSRYAGTPEVLGSGRNDTGETGVVKRRLLNDCNTVGCVAGWTVALFRSIVIEPLHISFSVEREAREILGLTPLEADDLFNDPCLEDENASHKVALERLNKLINT